MNGNNLEKQEIASKSNETISYITRANLDYEVKKKSVGRAYLLWFFFGILGGYRFYTDQFDSALSMLLISLLGISLLDGVSFFGVFFFGVGLFLLAIVGIWALLDAKSIPRVIRWQNTILLSDIVNRFTALEVDERAKKMCKALNAITDYDAGKDLGNYLRKHKEELKSEYDVVVDDARHIIDKTDYKFDINKLAVKPAIEQVKDTLRDDKIIMTFKYTLEAAQRCIDKPNFSNLLELREIVDEFKAMAPSAPFFSFTTGYTNTHAALQASKDNIDKELESAAINNLTPELAKVWVDGFRSVRSRYSNVKRMEDKNQVIESQGEVFGDNLREVMELVEDETVKVKVEGKQLDYFIEQATTNLKSGRKAIDFPQLSELIAKYRRYEFQTKEAKEVISMIDEYAKVFKGDSSLQMCLTTTS